MHKTKNIKLKKIEKLWEDIPLIYIVWFLIVTFYVCNIKDYYYDEEFMKSFLFVITFTGLMFYFPISSKMKDRKISKMPYEKFITTSFRELFKDEEYLNRLRELSKDKSISELNKDRKESVRFKDVFDELCREKIHKKLSDRTIDELLEIGIEADYYKYFYFDYMIPLVDKLTDLELKKYLNYPSNPYQRVFVDEHIDRLGENLKYKLIDEIFDELYSPTEGSKYLTFKKLKKKINKIDDEELEKLLSKIKDDNKKIKNEKK